MADVTVVRCSFYLRERDGDSVVRYAPISLDVPFRTTVPPSVGDLMYLSGRIDPNPGGDPDENRYLVEITDDFEVVGRAWLYPVPGSANWPRGERLPEPTLQVVVVRSSGLFGDEGEA